MIIVINCNQELNEIMVPSDDRYLKSLRRLGYLMGILVWLFSLAIVGLKEHVAEYVSSAEICGNDFLYKASTLVFSRMEFHCDLVLNELYWHSYAKLGIVWDFWLFLVYVSSAIWGLSFFSAMYKRRKNEVNDFVAGHRYQFILISLIGSLVAIFPIYFVFLDFPFLDLEKVPRPSWIFLEKDPYGIHASVVAISISYVSYITFSRFLTIIVAIPRHRRD